VADPEIHRYLDEAALARLTHPENYLGVAGEDGGLGTLIWRKPDAECQ
jgi:hypothetical protein